MTTRCCICRLYFPYAEELWYSQGLCYEEYGNVQKVASTLYWYFVFLLWGVEMCVFLILNVVMVTGPLGCCFLHPTNAAVLIVWQSGCTWMRCEAGIGGDQPDHPAQQPNLEQEFLGTGFSPRRKDGTRLPSSKCLLGYTSEISTHFPSISAFDISG